MNKKIIHHTESIAVNIERSPIRARVYVRILAIVLSSAIGVMLLYGTVLAETRGYRTQDPSIENGMVVAAKEVAVLDGTTTTYVEKSSTSRADRTIGIVVDQQVGPVTSSEPGSTVYVATNGAAIAYVSSVNGEVKKGDLLVASPIEGVLMRSTLGTSGVIGIAMQDFPADSNAETVQLQTINGKSAETRVAMLQVNMDTKTTKNSANASKSILQRIGEALVRREVTPTQAFIATVIFVLLLIVVGGIIYAAVSSSIISLGRNPFARKTILRSLLQVTILVAVVLAVGLGAIYWVLWI